MKCNQACSNKSEHCYIVKGVYLRLFAKNLKTWSIAINDTDVDVDTCSEELVKILQSAKTILRNPLRDMEKSRSKNT